MSIMKKIPRVWQRIGLFIILTYAISAPFEYFVIVAGEMGGANGLYALGGMWSPGIAAFIMMAVFRKEVGPFGWRWGKTKYQMWSILIPFLYCLVGYGFVWLVGLGGLMTDEIGRRLPMFAKGFALTCIAALGEEIGWSGFLVPQVAKSYGFTIASFTRGIAWSIWHYPMIIAGVYSNDSPIWFNLLCFIVLLTGTSFIYTWFRLKSGSLWTGMFLHASHNSSIQSFFSRITSASAVTAYFIDEFGVALAILSIILAIVFWRKRSSLPSEYQIAEVP
jgi:membrane protease YdiL (CAAX protease family)